MDVFIVEDHANFRRLLGMVLDMRRDLEICGFAASAEEALPEILRLRPELALIDLSLPGMSGAQLIKKLQEDGFSGSCVILSGHSEPRYAKEAMANGARGYILKGRPSEILDALDTVLAGDCFVSEEMR